MSDTEAPRRASLRSGIDLLLVIAPPWGAAEPPSLGTAYVAAAARRAGLETALADLNLLFHGEFADAGRWADLCRETFNAPDLGCPADLWKPGNHGLWGRAPSERFVAEMEPLLTPFYDRVAALRPKVIGFSVYGANFFVALELAKALRVRFPVPRMIFGGPWTGMWLHRKLLRGSPVEAAVLGEGEEVLAPLVGHLLRGDPLPPGLRTERLGDTLLAWPRPVDLAAEALPDYSVFDLARYPRGWFTSLTTRGCPKRCFFCSDTNLYSYRKRNLERIAEELTTLRDRHGLTALSFRDQMINADVRHLTAVCRFLVDGGFHASWEGNLSVQANLDDETASLMRAAGCRAVKLGLESGSDHVLALMGKHFTAAQASRAIGTLARHGIEVWLNLMVGYLDETEEDFDATRRFVAEHASLLGGIESVNALELSFGAKLWDRRGEVAFTDLELPHLSWTWNDNTPALRARRHDALIRAAEGAGLRFSGGVEISNLAVLRPPLAAGRLPSGVQWIFTRGRLQLGFGNEPVTEGLGLFFDWDQGGSRRFSYDLDWTSVADGHARADAGAFAWELEFQEDGGALTLVVSAVTDAPLSLDRFKVNLVLDDRYAAWEIAGQSGRSPTYGDWRKTWSVEGPRDAAGRWPLADGFAWDGERRWTLPGPEGFPALAFAAEPASLLPVAQGNCYPGVSVGFYRTDGPRPPSDRWEACRLRIQTG